MKTLYSQKKTERIRGRTKLLPILILTLIALACSLNEAMAQKGNLSDWNVPPPLPPRNLPKGNTGKLVPGKPIVLTLKDIPAISLPPGPAVQMQALAAIATTSPLVNAPDQPTILGIETQLAEIPLPGAPDALPLPQQSPQDVSVTATFDLPVPESPEMPVSATEPTPSGQTSTAKGPLPVMPDVMNQPSPVLPQGDGPAIWSTPGILENVSFKLATPAAKKAIKARGKGAKKVKSPSPKK
jgi:hypothetical protein